MKKIAIITTELASVIGGTKGGGGEILLKNLIFELIKLPDINLSIFTPDEQDLTKKMIDKYPQINFRIYRAIPFSEDYIFELDKIFNEEHFDKIINYNMAIPYKTTILQSHSHVEKLNRTFPLFKPIKKYFSKQRLSFQEKFFNSTKKYSEYIAVSQTLKNDYSKNFNIPDEKIKVIYPGVDIKEFSLTEKKNKPITFGIVANSSINKGGHYLLFALGILNILSKKFNLVIIAPKFKKDFLIQIIITVFCMRNKIKPLPFQQDMSFFYNEIDCLVLPSLNEAFGLVTLEAMERGKPAVVSSTAGCAEIIDSKNSLIFNRHSFFDFLKKLNQMIKIYNNTEEYKKMSHSARNTAEQYTWSKFAKKVIE